jgi:hypothetical protein
MLDGLYRWLTFTSALSPSVASSTATPSRGAQVDQSPGRAAPMVPRGEGGPLPLLGTWESLSMVLMTFHPLVRMISHNQDHYGVLLPK